MAGWASLIVEGVSDVASLIMNVMEQDATEEARVEAVQLAKRGRKDFLAQQKIDNASTFRGLKLRDKELSFNEQMIKENEKDSLSGLQDVKNQNKSNILEQASSNLTSPTEGNLFRQSQQKRFGI